MNFKADLCPVKKKKKQEENFGPYPFGPFGVTV